jgi:hypothetical protein
LKKEELSKLRYEQSHKTINNMLHKKCSKHNEYFPEESEWMPCTEEYFYKNKSNKADGLNTYCKKCNIKKSSIFMYANFDKHRESVNRNNSKPERKEQLKYNSINRRLNGKYLEWQRNNPEKVKEYSKEREQNKKHKINEYEWLLCKEYFNNCCAYCGLPVEQHYYTRKGITKQGDFHKEHVDHLGSNDLSNCVPACKSCNTSKHTATLDEWYNENNPNFTYYRLNKILKWLNEDYQLYLGKHK